MLLSDGRSETFLDPPESDYDLFMDWRNENHDEILEKIVEDDYAINVVEAEKEFDDWCQIEWMKICDRKNYDPN